MRRAVWLALLLAPSALAEVPAPLYPDCGPDGGCPPDFNDWRLYSWIPEDSQETIRAAELELGAGISADQAFQLHTGRWDVTVAVLDSGIDWDHSDLLYKFRPNVGELPPPQDADGNTLDYDANGDGLVNIRDYADDPRVFADAGRNPGVLDVSDLIYTFSDGVDDDGNGYVDDICGWDFFSNDNDPFHDLDDGYGTHGTGVGKDAVGEADNGGTVGICPSCSLLPVRTGDTFVTDGSRAGQGVAFAVDSGASVVTMAMGALSHPDEATAALDYAGRSGVVVVAAAADENAYHHNYPSTIGDVLVVHSIKDEGADEAESYSFMNFFNCNNYGPRIDFVSGTSDCATGATANIAGAVGLIQSAAIDWLGRPLTPSEVRSLLQATVDDVWLTEAELAEAETYPSSEGWDPFYGYGRVNVGDALLALQAGDVPPGAQISGPEWFAYVASDAGDVDLHIEATSFDGSDADWVLEWGQGWEPTDWTEVDSGSGAGDTSWAPGRAAVGVVPEPDQREGVLERVERVHEPAVTFRLRVTDADGRVGEARRTLFVHEDPDLLPGFPMQLGGSLESSPILVDLDGDQVFEVLLADGNGWIHALTGSGDELPGWPVPVGTDPDVADFPDALAFVEGGLDPEPQDGLIATVAAGDLDRDGVPEVVVGTLEGRVLALHADGSVVDGFPVWLDGREPDEFDRYRNYDKGVIGAPTLVDLDGDGGLDILIGGGDSKVYAWNGDGELLSGFPWELCHPDNCGFHGRRIVASPAVGDFDGDGDLDMLLGGNETLQDRFSVTHSIDLDSMTDLDGWPRQESGLVAVAALLPIVGTGHPASSAFADLDGDGDLEALDPVMLGQPDVLDHTGEVVIDLSWAQDSYGAGTNSNEPSFVMLANNPAFGDLDGDGVPDIVAGGAGTYALVGLALTQAFDFQFVIGAWSGATGEMLPGWPRQVEDFEFLMAPAIADLNGDDKPEVLYGSAGYMLHAWDVDGNQPEGWPKFTGQWILGSPAVGDITGDGYVEVVVTTREGYLYVWSTTGRADQDVQWQSIHHDATNSNNYEVALPEQIGPEEGCGCRRNKTAGYAGGWAAVLLVLVGMRRRK
jgi:hypothetical protein